MTTDEELSRRIERLERSNRGLKLAAGVLALGLAAIVGMALAAQPREDVDPPPARSSARQPVSLSVVIHNDTERLYRMWSDGTIERTQSPIFDFRGNDKWDLLRRP